MLKASFVLHTVVASFALLGSAVYAQTPTFTVTSPTQVVVTPPLSETQDLNVNVGNHTHTHAVMPKQRTAAPAQPDAALQALPGPLISATPGAAFDGVNASGYAPPDTNMAVGQNPAYNYILQTVNSRYAIYTKTGALVLGPNSLSSLWSALGPSNGCAVNNSGDVVAQYDKAADRWIVTQLGGFTAPFTECIAVSKTADPTGAYTLYTFSFGNELNDYPKFGIWPTATNSAYLATYNLFAGGSTFTGGSLCAYDRTKMLAGDPTAQSICTTIANDGGYLPSDLDGSTPPLDGTPGYFMNYETFSSLRVYAISPNFANPPASTLTILQDIGVAAFTEACAGATCIPQLGTSQQLDSLGDRLMYRLAFRNFGDHEAMVVNHSVTSGSSVGVRWYELRAPVATNSVFSLYQQGTFAPDATYRWMGSAAMDKVGNIGLGYSASSASIHPAIRYTGRVPSDPLGAMGTEASIIAGTGSQTGSLSRWGDYSALRIDPADDCTFWYTNEYLKASGSFNWDTGIGSFKFTSCGVAASPDFAMSATPSSQSVVQGAGTSYTVTVTPSGGFTGAVNLSASGLPAGAAATFSPNPTTGTSTMSVTTSATTPTGSYPLTITGVNGTLSHAAAVTLVVTAAPVPDFSMSATPTSSSVVQGSAASYTVNVARTGGFTGGVTLSTSALPVGATATFSLNPNTGVSSSLSIATAATTPVGTYPITITGINGSLSHTTSITLVVTTAPVPDFSLAPAPASSSVVQGSGATYTVSITRTGAFAGAVTFSVTGLPAGAAGTFSPNPASGASSALSVTTASTTPAGSYPLTITGVSGSLSHTASVTLVVTAAVSGDFTLSASPASQSLLPGGATVAYTVNIARAGGFPGGVSFTVAGLPAGATATFSPSPSTGASSTMKVTATGTTAPGTYVLTITGTSGTLRHTTTVTLVIQAGCDGNC